MFFFHTLESLVDPGDFDPGLVLDSSEVSAGLAEQ